MTSLVCTPISVHDIASALGDARQAKALGVDLVEFRLDEFFHGEDAQVAPIVRLISDSPLPCIATCRPTSEGGHYDGPDDARIALVERLGTAFGPGEHPPRYVDVEHATYERSANIRQKINLAIDHPEQVRDLRTSLILSVHDFQQRPADLSRRVLAMTEHDAAKVLKVAFLARSLRDNLEVFELLSHRDRPMIALAMGEFGLMSRVLAPKFGGFLTFASLRPTNTTAPGQPTVSELLDLYRFRSINPGTAVYGVVGSPVGQSLSPHIHNAGFESIGYNGVYLPLPIADGYESLKATLLELIHHPALTLRGLSITYPHKEHIVRLAREKGWPLDDTSSAIGAANTVSIERDGSGDATHIEVSNTDAPALLQTLTEALGLLDGKRIAIVGAGGVARAAAYALRRFARPGDAPGPSHGTVTVVNRTRARAEALAGAVPGMVAGDLADLSKLHFDILINCTPLGMRGGPAPAAVAVDVGALRPGTVVLDTVYSPIDTPLLRAAHEAGLRTVDGVSMFINQAAAQFTRWTGTPAPVRLFERIVREHVP